MHKNCPCGRRFAEYMLFWRKKMKQKDLRMREHDEYLSSIKKGGKGRPNIVLVFVDDMGYGDISCFGATAINTPCLDAIAAKGAKLNNFFAASPICSPSRFSCLTGRYPTRGYVKSVFFPSVTTLGRLINRASFPHGVTGICPDEITVAEALKASGYKTAMFGKWHLGDASPMLPNDKGFEYFYGAHYSVDMKPYHFYKNREIDSEFVDKTQLTPILTEEILRYIDENADDPFFIYYASPYPHHPAAASEKFKGVSDGGTYGDCVEELDWSCGEIYKKLEEKGIADNTLFIFTSDNGPWYEGNPGLHRGRKCLSLDGGQAVPFIAAYPAVIKKGTEINATAMNIDFFPTFLKMAGIENLPSDREIDGVDMMPILKGESAENTQEYMYYINTCKVFAVRNRENFKYIIPTKLDNPAYYGLHGPYLFDINHDVNESYDVSDHYPDIKEKLCTVLDEKQKELSENPRGWKK